MDQNPHEDTEWNDALRHQGILPQKKIPEKEITESEILNMIDATVQEKTGGAKLEKLTLDELDELEDEEEEAMLLQYREKRLQQIKAEMAKSQFGEVVEITAQNYVQEVNKAGEGIWVVLHLYKQGIPMCSLLNSFMSQLARKFPTTKFIKSISTVCIENYPDKNVPTVFIYFEGEMKSQFVGADALRGTNLTLNELEFLLGRAGAVRTEIQKDPRPKIKDALMSKLGGRQDDSDSDWEFHPMLVVCLKFSLIL